MKILIFILSLSTSANAGFGWFILGAALTTSSSNNVNGSPSRSNNVFMTMTETTECSSYKTSPKEENEIAISINLIQKVEESAKKENCLFIYHIVGNEVFVSKVKGKLSDFTTTLTKIKSNK